MTHNFISLMFCLLYCARSTSLSSVLTIPLSFNTGEEVHATEAEGMGRNQGYVHLQKTRAEKNAWDANNSLHVMTVWTQTKIYSCS